MSTVKTNGNALAGSLAASLQAIEIAKLLSESLGSAATATTATTELLFDGESRNLVTSHLVRNQDCRFSHQRWEIEPVKGLTLREALASGGAGARLFVPGTAFVSRLACSACGRSEECWRLAVSLDERSLRCPTCRARRSVRGFDLVERIEASSVPSPHLDRPLEALGLRDREVFGVASARGTTRHFVLGTGSDTTEGEKRAGDGSGGSIVLAGLGNIGSFLAPLLARIPAVGRVILADPDVYEAEQVASQDIDGAAGGFGKAVVQAERLKRIRPDLCVEVVAAPVEQLPLGALIGAIAASCLDSRAARLRLAARAWQVGSPFVDAAVGGGSSLLTRTAVYRAEPDAACFECAFDSRDYEDLEQVLPCAGSVADQTAA